MSQGLLIESPKSGAEFSPDGRYRYFLWRVWGQRPSALWIMLNPSTADAVTDDPTIRRCISFAKSWGCDGISVVNLFALRATNPRELWTAMDPCGPATRATLERSLKYGVHRRFVVAWGAAGGKMRKRQADRFWEWFGQRFRFECLGVTRDGEPRHPLYVRGDTQLVPYTRGAPS